MNPIDFPQAMRTLGAPEGSTNVTPLRVWTDGRECISCWMPTEEERQWLAAGEPICLRLLSGGTMPPALLEVGSPFAEPDACNTVDADILREAGIAP